MRSKEMGGYPKMPEFYLSIHSNPFLWVYPLTVPIMPIGTTAFP